MQSAAVRFINKSDLMACTEAGCTNTCLKLRCSLDASGCPHVRPNPTKPLFCMRGEELAAGGIQKCPELSKFILQSVYTSPYFCQVLLSFHLHQYIEYVDI